MATDIRLPALSPSMTEAALARWLKKEGDAVSVGEAIAEIETDKALMDLEAETDGILGRLYVAGGSPALPVDTVIGVIVQPGEAIPAGLPGGKGEQGPAAKAALAVPKAAAGGDAAEALPRAGGRVRASPLARSMARQHGIDLLLLEGSGPQGRIVKRDIEAALRASAGRAPAPAQAPCAAPAYEEIPNSALRRVIAQRLCEAKQRIPHFYLTIDCEIDALLALRRQVNAALPALKISLNDFVVKAVAGAMRRVPAVNASWTDTAVRRYPEVDISVAVATPSGLITPVVRRADARSVGGISAEIRELAERARHGKLLPHEYQGGGFTISNLGMYGIREFAAIINPPQSCILAVGAGQARPVVKDGAIAPATVMTCTLSVDHRVVDGAVGAEFLAEFKRLVENPLGLLV